MNAVTAPRPATPGFDFASWRDQRLGRLRALGAWLRQSQVPPALWQETLDRLESRLGRDLLRIAFVAELSRGKSELINALFFAGHGMRVLPAAAGRTTMCPLELGWDPAQPTALRLLPVETRLETELLEQWKTRPEAWRVSDLPPGDALAMAQALRQLTESVEVAAERARELGFPEAAAANPGGQVEIPRWRHAVLNVEHPLLAQGLAVLDTPGMNSLGAEPELTLSLIPSANTVVFMLAADAGVTRSDLELWRDHLGDGARRRALVVLNKIDVLWDPLLSDDEVRAQIVRQRAATAATLGVAPERVFAISAHKALLARIRGDAALLDRSGLPDLEAALTRLADSERRELIDVAWREALLGTLMQAERQLQQQVHEMEEQAHELGAIDGRNKAMVRSLAARVDQETREFDACIARLQALHAVNMRQLDAIAAELDPAPLIGELEQVRQRLRSALFKTGIRAALDAAQTEATARLGRAEALLRENAELIDAAVDRFNTEFAFTAPQPRPLRLEGVALDLAELRRDWSNYLVPARWLRLQDSAAADRVVLATGSRLRALLERGVREAQAWNRAAIAPLDAQVRERRRNLDRRMHNLRQVQATDGELADRIGQLRAQAAELRADRDRLRRYFEGAMK